MKKKLLITSGIVVCVLIIFFSQRDQSVILEKDRVDQKYPNTTIHDQQPGSVKNIKTLSAEQFENEIKLSEVERKFLKSFCESQADLVIAQAVLLSRHAPNSPQIDELRKAVFLNPQMSINSIAKFINNEDLPGFELEKSALLSMGTEIAFDESSKHALVEASTTELYKMVNALPDLPVGHSLTTGPEAEMNFIMSLGKEDANKLTSAVSYFKNASEGTDGVVQHKDVVNLLKEIDNPVIKNILARNYFDSNKEKLSSEALTEMKEVGVNYDAYAKSAE